MSDSAPENFIERVGAALSAPAQALAAAERPDSGGRAPADLALLILAGFAATNVALLVRAAWIGIDGDWMGGLQILLIRLAAAVRAPILFVIVGGILLTVLAGRRRRIAIDFDLACIAAVPAVAITFLLELAHRLVWISPGLHAMAVWAGLAAGAVILILAWRQTRRRPVPGAR